MVKKQTDPNGNLTEISYINQLTGQPDPFGRPGITYSPAVTINNVSHRRKVVSTYEDHLRRVTVAADLKAEGDGLLKSRTTQDELGRTVLVEGSENGSSFSISSQTVYEPGGRVIYQSNPRRTADASTDGWTRATKDVAGRVIEVATFSGVAQPPLSGTNSDWTGSVTTSYYAQETTVKDQAGKARKSVVDALGRLIKVYEDPEGLNLETSYTYDVLGNLRDVTQNDPLRGNQTRTFTYSSLSRLVSAFNPESGTISYQYDANGNLVLKIDPRPKPSNNISLADCSIPYSGNQIATCYKYDGLNRLEKRRYNDGTPEVTYTYDTLTNGKGMLTSVSSSVSTTSYTGYDALGRVLGSIQETVGYPAYEMPDYKYDLAGNLTSQKYPSGRIVSTSYDNAGRISGITGQKMGEPNKTYASSYSYTAHGAVGSVKLGNDLWEHTSFNGRLQSVEIGLGASSTDSGTLKLGYSYGVRVNNVLDATKNNGNLESQTITGAGLNLTQSYTYDQLNRLKTFIETVHSSQTVSLAQTYDYDRWGNRAITVGYRQSQTITPTPQSTSDFNPSNNRITNASYDNAGNLISAVSGYLFYYDAENKMIVHDDTSTVGTLDNQYSYDGDGQRVKKVTGTVTTVFVYNAMGQMVAKYTDDNSPSPTTGTSYFTADHLGTPRVITNKDKVVLSRHDYMPFGEEIKAPRGDRSASQGYVEGGDGVRQKFTQYERDNESGLDYAQARYYSNAQGRFTSVDPVMPAGISVDPQSWNRYSYCINNPLRYVDPTGLIWLYNEGLNRYTYVKDKDYDPDKWKGWNTVADGAVIPVGSVSGRFSKYKDLVGQYVSLNSDGSVSTVPDPTVQVSGVSEPVEVIIFYPSLHNFPQSIAGHVAYRRGDQVRSWELRGLRELSFGNYMNENSYRSATGIVLDVSPEFNDRLWSNAEYEGTTGYRLLNNNCGEGFCRTVNSTPGLPRQDLLLPVETKAYIYQNLRPYIQQINRYPKTTVPFPPLPTRPYGPDQ